jgi:hypothetical protein
MSKSPQGVKPPIELFIVVNQEADDHLCVSSLDKLYSKERFGSDKVYRVVLVEEVEWRGDCDTQDSEGEDDE